MEKKVNMLTYNFENIGSDTLYQYLYKCIKNDIIQGKIKSGEKLPSKRALAKNLAISVITVENAYGQLAAEGYIYSVPKSGFYVADLRDDRMKSESDLSENRIYSNKLNLTGGKNGYIADFTSNQTEQSAFPFSIWTKTMRAVMNDYQTELMLNPPCGGVMELRQSIADYLKAFRNMTVRPEQIIIGAGTEYLSSLLIQLLGKELKYSVENPGYHKIAKIYRSMGACYEYMEIEEDGPKVEELEEKEINVIHCSPSNNGFQILWQHVADSCSGCLGCICSKGAILAVILHPKGKAMDSASISFREEQGLMFRKDESERYCRSGS